VRNKVPGRIITLSENSVAVPYVMAEWGLSILVESPEGSILLDAGASTSVVHNADILGIDLCKIERIVLSHGHFDHTGGLRTLLTKMKRQVEIIAHPDILAPKYKRSEGKPDRYIGLLYQLQELESLGARFNFSRESQRLTRNILSTGEIPLETDFEQIEPGFFVKTADGWQPDSLADDQALVIETPQGLVMVLGCAHRGIINTLKQACKITGNSKIHLVLGGCHLKDASDEQVWQTISSLNEMGVHKLGVSHCTGMRATLMLAQTYGDDFIFNSTGNIIELDL
jgi:7,8-dihydropterin-6-yl-methyl-4-(beta-D-ribofuranosyl)aminobenzene 5'-phosphate synthase